MNGSDWKRWTHGKCNTLIGVVEMAKENNWIEFNKIDSLLFNRYFLFLLSFIPLSFILFCRQLRLRLLAQFPLMFIACLSFCSLTLIDMNNRGTFDTKSLNYTLLLMPLVGSTFSRSFSLSLRIHLHLLHDRHFPFHSLIHIVLVAFVWRKCDGKMALKCSARPLNPF